MVIIDFIRRASRQDLRTMLLMTTIAGFANALLVVVVNQVAGMVAKGDRPGILPSLIFVLAFAVYYQCNRFALLRANIVIEGLLKSLRIDVVDKLRRSELMVVDSLGRGNLYNMVAQETNHLSVTFPLLVDSFQQFTLLLVSLIYLGYLSKAALVVFFMAVVVGIAGYLRINKRFRVTLNQVAAQQAEMLEAIGDIIHGYKEMRLNTRRSDSVYSSYRKMSQSAEALLTESGDNWASMIVLSSFVVYLMLGVVGFVFPQFISGHSTIVFQLIPTLLFCMGPLTKIVVQSPMFVRADVGLSAILDIENRLDAAGSIAPSMARDLGVGYRKFKQITYTGVSFSYRDASGAAVFTAGPWDLKLARGETVFLVGGNGSGKSTALRLITGLYRADRGRVAVDGTVLEGTRLAGFRELFSAIFGDFHLFDRLYGVENADPNEVNRLIDEMGLTNKVRFEDGRFTDLNLSTGQRKRLALIAALLEDRPIYVFDEWSAEQDVHFREQFYRSIIPGLKAKGKTVLAVTHDERFWHLADRVIKLDLGEVLWERTGAELEK
jgi:putative ATP-binding cassette transporter